MSTSLRTTPSISQPKKIDASTCLFPENTWFIRDCNHAAFPDCIEQFKSILVKSKEQPTIENMKEYGYTQFMTHSAESGTLSEITGLADSDKLYNHDFISTIFRFLTALIKLITKIMSVKKA